MPICNLPTVGDQSLTLRLPGGPTLQCLSLARIPSPYQVTKCLLNQASAALAPLSPVFNLIDMVLAIKGVVEAIPSLLTDPTALFEAIAEVVEKAAAMAHLIPQLSVPLMIIDLLDVTIVALRGVQSEFELIKTQISRIAAAEALAAQPGNGALADSITCANQLLDLTILSVQSGMAPLNSLFAVINLFLGLIGQDPIPPIDDLSDDPDEAIEALNVVIETLTVIRAAIPIP
jgi:hypothetical protein